MAAFGGRADIMELLDPRRPESVPYGGTYNGHPLGMAAGLATLRELTPEVYADLSRKGDRVRFRLRELFEAHDVAAQVTGIGSLFNVHFTSLPVRDHRAMRTADQQMHRAFFLGLINNGILLAPRAMGAIPTPAGNAELEQLVDAVEKVIPSLEPG